MPSRPSVSLALVAACFLAASAPVLRADDDARLAALAKLVVDDSPAVRLEAVRALAHLPSARAAELALGALDKPMDPTLDYALWLTVNDLAEPWVAALESGAWKPEGREKQLEFGLKAIRPELASRVLGRLLAARPLSRDGAGPWIELIGQAGSPKELRLMLDQAVSGGLNEAATTRALRSLGEAFRLRKVRPDGDPASVLPLLQHAQPDVREQAVRLVGAWKLPGSPSALGRLAGEDSSGPVRQAALETLRALGGKESIAELSRLAALPRPELRTPALAALAALDLSAALPGLLAVAPTLENESQAQDFWRAILPVKGSGKALADAFKAKSEAGEKNLVSAAGARAGMRVAREGGRNDLDLAFALARAGGLAADAQAFTTQLLKDLATKASQSGNPVRGESLYRRDALACVSCHAIGGAGGKVGPDMTSIGASAPIDYLVESVLLPNAKIKEGYHAVSVATKDGSEYIGTLARETPQEIVLRNAAGAEQPIAKADVAKREQSPNSLMPAGLLDAASEQDQLDLFAFLSQLGKPGEYDASRGGVARRWRLTQTVHTDAQAGKELWPLKAGFEDRRWTPTYALVNGSLTKPLLSEILKVQVWTSRLAIFAATEINLAQAGTAHFQLSANPAAELWIDGQRVGGAGASQAELSAGLHRVIVKLDPKQLPDSFKLESPDVAFVLN
jgi:putative heme-binding domain-containing protein